jgi:TRAP-type C4-dicarboxylate transport system permease small subunit
MHEAMFPMNRSTSSEGRKTARGIRGWGGRAVSGLVRLRSFVEIIVPSALMIGMVVVVSAGVVARYAFNHPIAAAGELATLMAMWAIFLGAAGAMGRGLHLSVETLVHKFSVRSKAATDAAVGAVLMVVLFWIAWIGYEFAIGTRFRQLQTLGIPYAHMTMAVPVGCLLIGLHVLQNLPGRLKVALTGRQPAGAAAQSAVPMDSATL